MQSGNRGDVIEINLRDLLFDLLYRWRSLLAAALIGALLMGGYALWLNRKTESVRREAEAAAAQRKEQADQKLAEQKQLAEERYQAEVERLSPVNQETALIRNHFSDLNEAVVDYLEFSVLMNLDPYHEWKASAVYAVVPDAAGNEAGPAKQADTAAIADAYASAVFTDWDPEKLRAVYGEKSVVYASELFSCSVSGKSGSFTVTAVGGTEEMAKAGLAYLKQAVEAFAAKNGWRLGPHHLALLNEYALQVVDTETEARQRNMLNLRAAYQNGINSNPAVSPSRASVEPEPEPEQDPLPELKPVAGMAVIGGLIGLFALLFVYFLRYVLCGKLQRSERLARLGIPVYGEMNHSRACRSGKGFDKWLESLEFRKNKTDRDTVLGNVAALLEEKADGGLLLTGTLPDAELRSFLEELRGKMKPDCPVLAAGNLLKNRGAVEAARGAQAVVLVEEKYVSDVREIDRAAELLSVCGTPVVGAVIL